MFKLRSVTVALVFLAGSAAMGFAQGGGGGMCQGGGGGGGGSTGTTGTTGAAGFRTAGTTAGISGGAINSPLVGLQLSQQQAAQFRQAQLNALAANAQIRAETQAVWEAARQRKQQALALRQARERARPSE